MIKFAAAAAFAGLSLAAVAMPAQAASSVGTMVACDSTTSISDNDTAIINALANRGVNVSSVEDWNGCIRAYVTKPDGTVGMQFFDPSTLQQVG
ncbi:hypothetical protein WH87_17280 [Devosia epidermidihirudinis]|uniref:PepSY domain-containing protein n=1 Tax=Devosia epidermidihirudinis TaxID=1293439 RepID=A0A0F5Q346_9HYPH|nr:hypothetical protein [Devosia epidermidihirudinis]KKC35327.1 hypothetical protein WH87_17280 [Devosia epidermidihirudinis]